MRSARTIGIDLPLKALVWRDDEGQTWFTYNEPVWLAKRHGEAVAASPQLSTMTDVLAAPDEGPRSPMRWSIEFAKPPFRARLTIVYGARAVLNAGGWLWAFAAFHDRPELLWIALLVFGLGLHRAVVAAGADKQCGTAKNRIGRHEANGGSG